MRRKMVNTTGGGTRLARRLSLRVSSLWEPKRVMGECSRPARSIAPPAPPSPSTHTPRQPAVRPASTQNNTSLRPPACRNTGGGSTLAWRARALGRPGWPPTAISCYVFPAQPGPAVSAMAGPATTAACEDWPCGERRGIAGGATPRLVLSSTLEPLSALSECTRPAQGPVLRACGQP